MHTLQNLFYLTTALHVLDVNITHLQDVEQLSDKINSVMCASCWDLYSRKVMTSRNL